MSRQFLSSEQWKQSLGWGEPVCWLNIWIMCYAIIRCISLPSVALHAGMSTAGRDLGAGSQGGEVRWWCPCPSAPSSLPLSSYEPQQNHTNMIQCPVWGGHGIYQVFSCIVANNMISCYWIGKQINMHHWVLSPHCTVDNAMTSGGEGEGLIVITWTYIVISAWGHHPPPHWIQANICDACQQDLQEYSIDFYFQLNSFGYRLGVTCLFFQPMHICSHGFPE